MFKRLSEQDYYQVLEVPYNATAQQIQAAYDSVREIYQVDSVVANSILTPGERRSILDRVAEAYRTLIAEDSRRFYDESLSRGVADRRGLQASAAEWKRSEPPLALPVRESFPRLVKSDRPRPRLTLGEKEEASGDFLRRAREAAGIDIRTIAEETKIGAATLVHIEEERTERLPAPVYLKSFVAQYARCLGLEAERVAASYVDRVKRLATVGA